MKKTYQERFNEIDLRDDYKEDILHSVLHHEEKKERRFSFKPRYLLAPLFALAFVSVPFLIGNNVFGTKNSFTIQANDEFYKVEKSTLEILNTELATPGQFASNCETGEITTQVFDAPLTVYFKGDTVKSVTYTIENAEFYKINEAYKDFSDPMSAIRLNNGNGGFMSTEKKNLHYQVTNSDSNANIWWFPLTGTDSPGVSSGSVGNQITIDNEDQGTVQGLYGFSFQLQVDKKLLDSTRNLGDYEAINKEIVKTINKSVLDVRVDYNDGTYETTQLKFHINENNNMQVTE
ncbi:hypothetical protein ACWG0P_10425 [Amedibacillus sp. YH-ame6]